MPHRIVQDVELRVASCVDIGPTVASSRADSIEAGRSWRENTRGGKFDTCVSGFWSGRVGSASRYVDGSTRADLLSDRISPAQNYH